ncbi:MAG: DUF2157 domain-containing protein [Candidatus Omnitrophica bacterium]|nr:DUF2157 domain-containing protein [Candidatus Omnitrophota bacterium]
MDMHHNGKERIPSLFAHWLRVQLTVWLSKDILSPSQAERIKDLYIWPKLPNLEKSPIRFIVVLQAIGAFLIGVGVISLIAFNWIKFANFTKLGIIIGAVIALHCAGFFIRRTFPHLQRTGVTLVLLGNLFFGGGIWLLAQMYHMHRTFSEGVLLWAVGVIPLAYAVRSRLNYFLAVILFVLWVLAESVGSRAPHFTFLLLALASLIPLSYYLKEKRGLAICIVTVGVWLLVSTVFWFRGGFSAAFFIPLALYGVLLLTISNFHEKEPLRAYHGVYFDTGIVILAIVFLLVPLFGVLQRGGRVLLFPREYLSFWIYNGVLFAATVICREMTARVSLDKRCQVINRLIPYLLVAVVYILFLPYKKPSFLLDLFPLILIAFMYWYYSRSRILLNFFLLYLALWLPFFLIEWHQMFLLFLLYLACGVFSYMLGWVYIAKYQTPHEGDLLKVLGLFLMFFSIYIFSFNAAASFFSRNFIFPHSFDFWFLFIALHAGMALLYRALRAFRYPAHKNGLLIEEKYLITLLPFIPLVLFVNFKMRPVDFWYTFLLNSFYVGLLIVCIAAGYRRSQTYMRVIAFVFLVLLVLSRYFELEWSLLYKAVLFISTGAFILLAGIFIEKHKKKVVVIED